MRIKGSGKPTSERFWPKVRRIDDADSCWEWTGALNGSGYGVIGLGGRGTGNVRAHRFAYEETFGPIPAGLFLCHRCDNRSCVRPSHMFVGTPADNTRDMVAKDREMHGERSTSAKLTERQVVEARARRAAGETCHAIARDYGVCHQTISLLTRGLRWRKVA